MTVHVLQNDKALETMRGLHNRGFRIDIRRRGNGYDLTAYQRETAHGSHERTQPVRLPRHWRNSGGDDLPPAA